MAQSLRDGGGTALGPALVAALGMCSVPGSSIVCLTDGEANAGLGSLNGSKDVANFYVRKRLVLS